MVHKRTISRDEDISSNKLVAASIINMNNKFNISSTIYNYFERYNAILFNLLLNKNILPSLENIEHILTRKQGEVYVSLPKGGPSKYSEN